MNGYRNLYERKTYSNAGNETVIAQVSPSSKIILDVGCGAGDNARILKRLGKYVVGITLSDAEAKISSQICDKVLVADIDKDNLLLNEQFDCIIMSHVCEHLPDPESSIMKVSQYLKDTGEIIIALPNMAFYKLRFRLLKGNWKMDDTGPFDRTHLHFYSFDSANDIFNCKDLRLVEKIPGNLTIPLWPFRMLFPRACSMLDRIIGQWFPNLFAIQVVLVYKKV